MDYEKRLQKFQESMEGQVDLVFLPLSADLHYLLGVPREVPNYGAVIHPGMWLEGAWIVPHAPPILTLPRMTAVFGGLDEGRAQIRILDDHADPAAMARDVARSFDLAGKVRIAVGDVGRAETVVCLQEIFPQARFSSATRLLNPLRRVKSPGEIALMRQAGEITEKAFGAVLPQLRQGMTELEIISEVDYQLRAHGSLGPSFTTSMYNSGPDHELIFGKREERWHRPLHPPVALLFDFGAVHQGYCYDFGRTVFFGQPPDEFHRIYDLVMRSQQAGIGALKAGATCAAIDAAARRVIEEAGYGEAFRHRLGHGIGMDVHEAPFLTESDHTVVQEGMLFTVEPSIMQFHNFSARVEDVVAAEENGGSPLTEGFQSLHVVE